MSELLTHKLAVANAKPGALVFCTGTGEAILPGNVRRRVLGRAVEKANEGLTAAGSEPLPEGLTPHSLRRTFASLLVALREDPATVKRQMGHTTAHLTLAIYAAAMDWTDGERDRLRALVEGQPVPVAEPIRAPTGHSSFSPDPMGEATTPAEGAETA